MVLNIMTNNKKNKIQTILEPSKEIPVIGQADVVVVGSGMAGSAAAIAASRNGARVYLIEKENCPGGLATLGLIWYYLPLCDGKGRKLIGGLGEEFLKASIKYGPGRISSLWEKSPDINEGTKKRYMAVFNPASFIISLEELILKNNIEILYDSRFCNVMKDGDRITAVIIENKSGRSAVLCKSVVDATGDGDVCHMSGEETVSMSNNKIASWFYSCEKLKIKRYKLRDHLYNKLPPDARTYSGDDYKDVTDFSIEGRKMILEKILEKKKRYKDIYPLLLPTIPQLRMTRRLKGRCVLSHKDERKYFDDTVGMIGDWRKAGPIYCIPYRSLIAVKTKNLITAGRCISASDDGWDVTRVIGPCALTGEAAGTAAALSVKQGNDLNELSIDILQNKLRKQNVIIDKDLVFSTKN